MSARIKDKLLLVLEAAARYNPSLVAAPEAVLWPDKDEQWASVIESVQAELPQLLVFGAYDPDKKRGPAVWLRCVINGAVSTPGIAAGVVPIVYLPGVSKEELRTPETAGPLLQPIIPYAYTGAITNQPNGREWTVQAILENKEDGLGVALAKDRATKDALLKTLPALFEASVEWPTTSVDAAFLHTLLIPDAEARLLTYLCRGDAYLEGLPSTERRSFTELCRLRFSFDPDNQALPLAVEKLGSQKGPWKKVWQHYATGPQRYPELADLLRAAKPEDLGTGLYEVPKESWPQIAEAGEEELLTAYEEVATSGATGAAGRLAALSTAREVQHTSVWSDLGYTPLADALPHLIRMVEGCDVPVQKASLDALRTYYFVTGAAVDSAMRTALACARKSEAQAVIGRVIRAIYKPWLEKLAYDFQDLIGEDAALLTQAPLLDEPDEVILFVDAFRYEMAAAFKERLEKAKWSVALSAAWSALPSLTPTAKPAISPIATDLSLESICNEFRPQLSSGKDLSVAAFRQALEARGYAYAARAVDAKPGQKCWLEIGDIDRKGHEEGEGLVRRVEELFDGVQETLDTLFASGISRIKIVTDHGWLLLPGGLPKTTLGKDLTETRWGRCALVKEGATTDLQHLPWTWNKGVYIAYAPGISFFKQGEAYAHGGLSLQECLIPVMVVEKAAFLPTPTIKEITWRRLACIVQTEGAPDGYRLDIRTKLESAAQSVLEAGEAIVKNGRGALMVSDDYQQTEVVIVLMDPIGRIVHSKKSGTGT